MKSARLVARSYYGQLYWSLKPNAPLAYHLPTGGTLLLDHKHAFTGCFWPDVEHYEPEVRTFLECVLRPGDTFIDCGANVGYFSVQAGALVGNAGRVVSIEANPRTFKLLERNLRANAFGIPVHCALTSEIGEVELFMPQDWDVYSSLRAGSLVEGRADQSFKVTGRTLDDVVRELALERIDLVKIDIEGGELDVLRSAPNVLRKFRPLIITEYGINTWASFDVTHRDLEKLAREFNYSVRLFDTHSQKLVGVRADVWQRAFVNLVLMPDERLQLPLKNNPASAGSE
jgi:FkbM family methyltransferase